MSIDSARLLLAETYKICRSGEAAVRSIRKMGIQIENRLQNTYAEKVRQLTAEDPFSVKSFVVYMSHFKKGDYQKFKNWGNYGDYLAIFCGKNNFNDFKKEPPPYSHEEVDTLLSELFRNIQKSSDIPSYFRAKSYFEDLEFGSHRIRVNCVSFSLIWAANFLKDKVREIESNANNYRYILTEKAGQIHRKRIVDLLKKHPDLKERIEIRNLYGGAFINSLECTDVAFPLNNDLVVYEFYGEHQNEYTRIEAIIGITPNVGFREENYSITINESRGHEILAWFDAIWEKIADTSSKIEVDSYLNGEK